jgi:hypothetical protein
MISTTLMSTIATTKISTATINITSATVFQTHIKEISGNCTDVYTFMWIKNINFFFFHKYWML